MSTWHVSSGGTVSETYIDEKSDLGVYSGGTAIKPRVYGGYIANYGEVVSASLNGAGRWGIMSVFSGGTANDTTVSSGGQLNVSSGGIASRNTVNGNGIIDADGGTVINTTLNSGGHLYVSSGGTANSTTVNHNGFFFLGNGGVANSTTVESNGSMTVSTGGSANSTTVSRGGVLRVSSGGTATGNTVHADAIIEVYGKGYINQTTVLSGGNASIEGSAFNTTLQEGNMIVSSGASAYHTLVSSRASLECNPSGTIEQTSIYKGGDVTLRGVARNDTVFSGGVLEVKNIGRAVGTTVSSGGLLTISSGGSAEQLKLCNGSAIINSGDLTSAEVSSGGYLEVLGTANSATVSSGGSMKVVSGIVIDLRIADGGVMTMNLGTLTRATVGSGGTAVIRNLITATEVTVRGELQVLKDGEMAQDVASDLTVTNSGHLLVSGWVNGAVVDSKGKVTVESGGMFKNATVTNGSVTAKTGASVSGLTLSSGGSLNVSSGGIVSQTTVSSGGVVTGVLRDAGLTFSGGTLDLNIAKASADGIFLVDAASYSGFKSDSYDCTLTVTNKQLNGTYNLILSATGFNKTITVQNAVGYQFGTLTVGSGPKELLDGVTYDLKLDDGDLLVTVTGGAIPDPIVSGITLIDERRDITSGMSAIDVKVSAGGILNVFSKGSASNTTVYDGGEFNVNSGGRVEGITIEKGGSASIFEDVMAENVVVNGGIFSLEQYGWAQYLSNGHAVSGNTVVRNGGQVIVHENAYLVGAYVSQGGRVDVLSDGTFETGRVNGAEVYAFDGALVSRVDLESGGILNVESGGRVQHINVSAGGVLTGVLREASELTFYGGTLDLDISTAAPEGEFLIDEQSYSNIDMLVSDKIYYLCTLTVDGNQANGAYRLIEDAYGFDKSITVKSASGAELGTLTVGQTAEIGGASYALNLSDDYHLTVTVSGAEPPPPTPTPGDTLFFAGDFNGDLFDTLAVQKNSAVTIYQNGEAWGIGITLDPGWSVVGTGDFNGDNLDDFLRVNTEGYVVGEMSNGNGTFTPQVLNLKNAGWDILGTGNFDGIGPDDVLIANPTAASETVGLLGYWKGGTEWTLINGYSPEWTMVSTGDFNGDGKCDMLWKNEFIGEGGLTYNAYCTWIVEDPVDWRMVSVANPAEWNFLCSGDFDGNGSHDIAMINDVGVVGIWGVSDGYLNSWSILSAVTSEWQLAGVADFNADGTDDIAWSNADTGLTGYWQINDKTLTTWANIATL